MHFSALTLLSILSSISYGHISMQYPYPRDILDGRSYAVWEQNEPMVNVHPSICHGLQTDTTIRAGNAFAAGDIIEIDLYGTAVHDGGHCTFWYSTDDVTFTKIIDIKDCTLMDTVQVTLPSTLPTECQTKCTFAWTWIPAVSARCEIYMNCADIKVTGALGGESNPISINFQTNFIDLAENEYYGCERVDDSTHWSPVMGPLKLDYNEENTPKPTAEPTPAPVLPPGLTQNPTTEQPSAAPITPAPTYTDTGRVGPWFVAYIDFPTCQGIGTATDDANCLAALGVPGHSNHQYNVINFAFYVSDQDLFYDAAKVWANPSLYFSSTFRDIIADKTGASDAEFRSAVKSLYEAAGVKLILSVGGGTDHPIANGIDAAQLAVKVANLVTMYDYDGVDIDWEEGDYLKSGVAQNWLITLTTDLRDLLGPDYIITHAPQAPYIGGSYNGGTNHYVNGGYLEIHEQVGSMIDWYNVQFYNQGSTTYGDFDELFVRSTGWCEHTAVYEMIEGDNPEDIAIPAEKIVVGKFIREGQDGSAGWISAENMRDIFIKAIKNENNLYPEWSAGFMIWQFPGDKDQDFAWSNTVIQSWDDYTPRPTESPITPQPTAKPTPSPTLPPGVTYNPTTAVPTSEPTPSPTFGEATGNLEVQNSGTLSEWWYACKLNGLPDGYDIESFEIEYDNGWIMCTQQSWAIECQPGDNGGFVLPLSVRITSTNNEQIIANDVIQSYEDGAVWDLGTNFGAEDTTTTTAAPPTATTTTAAPPTSTTTVAPPTSTTTVAPPTTTTTAVPPTSTTTTAAPPTTTVSGTTTQGSTVNVDSLKVQNQGSLSEWWYAATLIGLPNGVDVASFEIVNGDGWVICNDAGWAFECQPGSNGFVLPLTVRITASDGQVIVSDAIASYEDQAIWDLGTNFEATEAVPGNMMANDKEISDPLDGSDRSGVDCIYCCDMLMVLFLSIYLFL